MTREEAIKVLKRYKSPYTNCAADAEANEAIEKAISALEQEPTDDYFRRMAEVVISQLRTDRDRLEDKLAKLEQEPSGDLISREAVLDLAKKGVLVSNRNYKSVCKAINELPSVNPQEPKVGHWDSRTCKCSECGYQIAFSEYAERKNKFCPSCGARMVEPQESEE